MWVLGQIIFGGLLLLAGRRLYWLFSAGVGFVIGLRLAQRFLPEQSDDVMLVVALAVAVIFAALAVVGQKFVIGLMGFIAGGIGLLRLLELLDIGTAESGAVFGIAVFIAGGVLGAILLSKLLDLGLIILSSLVGSQILLGGLEQLVEVSSELSTVALVALMGVGLLVQLGALRKR